MIKKFVRRISYFDTFGAEVKLNLNKRETHQSPFGGFCTILLVVALSVLFIKGTISVIKKETYTISSNKVLNVDPPISVLRSSNFMVAFQAESPIVNQTSQLLQFTFSSSQRKLNENGTYEKSVIQKYNLEKCTTQHFADFDDSTIYYRKLKDQLPDYYCLPLDYNISVQGTYSSDLFQYGKVSVEICNTADCYSASQIKQFQDEGYFNSSFNINTIMLNRIPNLNLDSNYISYLYTDFFLQAKIGLETSTNIFLEQQILSLDRQVIPGIQQIDRESIFSIDNNKLTPTPVYTTNQTKVASFYLRLSQTESQYKKSYYRFDELISYVGGITKFLATIIGYFILKYNQTGLQIKLANALYQFDMPEKKKGELVFSFQSLVSKIIDSMRSIEEVVQKFKASAHRVIHLSRATSAFRLQSNPTTINDKIEDHEENQPAFTHRQYAHLNSEKSEDFPQESSQSLNLDHDKKKYLDLLIKVILESRKKLSFGVHFLAKQVTGSIKKSNTHNYQTLLFERSRKMILRDMDILVIMTKLQEIEKIKHVVLNKTQRKVFNYLPKPIISINKEKLVNGQTPHHEQMQEDLQNKKTSMLNIKVSSKSLLGGRQTFNTQGKFKNLYEAYETISLNSTIQEKESEINDRLIELVEPTIQYSFNSLVELEKISRQIRLSKRKRVAQPKGRVQIMGSQNEIGEHDEEDDMDCATLKEHRLDRVIQKSPQSLNSFRKHTIGTTSSRQQPEIKLTKVKSKQDLIDIEICSS